MQAGKSELELLAIRTLCAGKDAAGVLLNTLNAAHFHYPTSQLMYRRLMARMRGEGSCPAWNDLINDPTIPEEKRMTAQRQVRVKNLKPLVSKRKGESLFESLDRYRKLRQFYELLNKGGNAIKQPAADIDDIIKSAKSELIAIDVNQRGAPITVDGVKSSHVNEALINVDARIATGFDEYDERSGGIPQGAVFLLGAESGMFKSVMAIQLAKNIAAGKRKIGKFSLEMTQPEVTQRLTANELEIEISDKINKWQWLRRRAKSASEIKRLDDAHFAWAADVATRYEEATKSWSEYLHITCPSDGVDINWILAQAEMSDREIIFIDYLGLLDGLAGDDQWRAMSNAARICKIWTNRTGKTVILMAQMRFEEGKISLKYSTAVKDHVNNMWGWTVLEVNGRTYLCIHQAKARGSKAYHFVLRVWPEFNKIGNLKDAKDDEVARLAVEDMKASKDPAKRYMKVAADAEGQANRRLVELDGDDDEVVRISGGGFAGSKVKTYDLSNSTTPWDDDDTGPTSKNTSSRRSGHGTFAMQAGGRITASEIRRAADQRTRATALAKLRNPASNLTEEEAGIQAAEVIRRYEEASIGHRMNVTKLARELLGLTQTRDIMTSVKRLQGDKSAQKKLTKQQLEIHRAQVETIRLATDAIKTKGREFVSEDDFYAKDDLTLSVERGQEPIAPAGTLDRPWQNNAVAWADQPAITLPNSAKPKNKRWGANGDEDSVETFKRITNSYRKDPNRKIPRKQVVLWPPHGGISNYHYLDDIQLDTAVGIATKLAVKDVCDIPADDLARDVAQYAELMGPGRARINSRRLPRVRSDEKTYKAACKKLGVKYG